MGSPSRPPTPWYTVEGSAVGKSPFQVKREDLGNGSAGVGFWIVPDSQDVSVTCQLDSQAVIPCNGVCGTSGIGYRCVSFPG